VASRNHTRRHLTTTRSNASDHDPGLTPSWTPTYNAGANPITVWLNKADLAKPAVQDLLRASYRFLAEESAVQMSGPQSRTATMLT